MVEKTKKKKEGRLTHCLQRITGKWESWWTNLAYPGLTAQCGIQTCGKCPTGLDAFVTSNKIINAVEFKGLFQIIINKCQFGPS